MELASEAVEFLRGIFGLYDIDNVCSNLYQVDIYRVCTMLFFFFFMMWTIALLLTPNALILMITRMEQ